MAVKDLTPKFVNLKSAEDELMVEYRAGEMPFGDSFGGMQAFSSSFKRGYGNKVFGSDDNGIWLGNADFSGAPFRVDMDGKVYATQAEITGSIHVFKQDAIPTSVSIGDMWFDTNDNNKAYRAAAVGADAIATGEWEAVDDQRAADALLQSSNTTLSAVLSIGGDNIKLDGGANPRMTMKDSADDTRFLLGDDGN